MEDEENAPQKLSNGEDLRISRRKRQKLLIDEVFYDYANNTTLHGIPYITRRGVSVTEKVFWSITFIVSVCWCSYLIYEVWLRWKTSPVIVTISEFVVPVDRVPFPSVTICPQAKCKVSEYNFTNELIFLNSLSGNDSVYPTKSTLQRIKKFNAVGGICNSFVKFYSDDNDTSDSSFVDYILEVSPSYRDVFVKCLWKGRRRRCGELFQKVLTKEGVCFTTNAMAYEEIFKINNIQNAYQYLYTSEKSRGWTLDHGYEYSYINPYPARGDENPDKPPLVVELKENKTDRDSVCNSDSSGFKIYLQHPSDLPQSSMYYYAVLDNQVSSLALSFGILNTSESLASYSSETRQCHFPEERYLRYFRIYTAKNCWIECMSNYTFETCACVDFYMPHNDSNHICSDSKEACISYAQRTLESDKSYFEKCDCLPACVAVDYDAEILKTKFDAKKMYESWDRADVTNNISSNYIGLTLSKLEVYYKRPRFLSMRRSELFGLTEFLANCGGLLGLFLGFSFLSIVEVLYYLTLRLWCTLKKDTEEEKLQRKNKKETSIVKY